MAMSLNRLTIIGNLTRDPEARTTTGGTNIVTFSVATNYKWKAKDSGEQKEEVEYHNVKAFGKVADIVMQYLKKGAKVYIEGRLRTEHWEDKTGTKKQRTVVMLESMLMLGNKSDTPAARPADDSAQPAPTDEPEIDVRDIPF